MNDYPFTPCLYPRIVTNKYTGTKISVGCGWCRACMQNKANKAAFKCSLEEMHHKYGMFITLTFNNDSIPLLQPLYSKRRDGYVFYNMCRRYNPSRLEKQKFFLPRVLNNNPNWLSMLQNKVNLNGLIPFCTKIDLQLFFKRLRKHLSKYTDEKIRYYAVSELGPIHFRPHYHIILYFDQKETLEALPKCIKQVWTIRERSISPITKKNIYTSSPLGRIDFSLSRGNCASYVAKYVNSNCVIPPLYQNSPCKPFNIHSRYFAQDVFEVLPEEVFKKEPIDIIRTCTELNGRNVEFTPFSTYLSRFFPRCKGYDSKTYAELYKSYTIFELSRLFYGENKVSKIARSIFLDMYLMPDYRNPIVEYFYDLYHCTEYYQAFHDVDVGNRLIKRIESELYLSKRFLHNVCGCDPRLVHVRIKQIQDFYNQYSQFKLRNFYEQQILYANKNPDDLDGLRLFYDNLDYNYNDTTLPTQQYFPLSVSDFPEYKKFASDVVTNFNKSIKHKRLNDLNNIFL